MRSWEPMRLDARSLGDHVDLLWVAWPVVELPLGELVLVKRPFDFWPLRHRRSIDDHSGA